MCWRFGGNLWAESVVYAIHITYILYVEHCHAIIQTCTYVYVPYIKIYTAYRPIHAIFTHIINEFLCVNQGVSELWWEWKGERVCYAINITSILYLEHSHAIIKTCTYVGVPYNKEYTAYSPIDAIFTQIVNVFLADGSLKGWVGGGWVGGRHAGVQWVSEWVVERWKSGRSLDR